MLILKAAPAALNTGISHYSVRSSITLTLIDIFIIGIDPFAGESGILSNLYSLASLARCGQKRMVLPYRTHPIDWCHLVARSII